MTLPPVVNNAWEKVKWEEIHTIQLLLCVLPLSPLPPQLALNGQEEEKNYLSEMVYADHCRMFSVPNLLNL